MMTTKVSITLASVAKMSPRFRAARRCENGSAAVEFGLTMPVLILVLLGILELSLLTFANLMLDAGVREAARYGLTGQQNDDPVARYHEIERIVKDRSMDLVTNIDFQIYTFPGGFGSIDMTDLDSATSVEVREEDDGSGEMVEVIDNADGADDVVLYRAVADYVMMTPLFPGLVGFTDTITLEASFAFRNEPWE